MANQLSPSLDSGLCLDNALFNSRRNRLGDLLVEEQIINKQQLGEALTQQKQQPHSSLGNILLGKRLINNRQLQHCLHLQKVLRMALFSLSYTFSSAAAASQELEDTEDKNLKQEYSIYSDKQLNLQHYIASEMQAENHFNDGMDQKIQHQLEAREAVLYSISATQLMQLFSDDNKQIYAAAQPVNQRYFINMLNDGVSLSMRFSY